MTERKKTNKHTSKQSKAKKSKKPNVAELEQRIDELTTLLQRERADSENLRRRHEDHVAELSGHVKADVIKELLPVIDNLERALNHAPKEFKDGDYVKGVESIARQLEEAFKKLGVEKIKTVGEAFDPDIHEAVSMDDTGKGKQEIVAEELQSGYKVDDRVIRHAMVRVKLG